MTPPANHSPGQRARLRLIATTDLHMHLTAYDYAGGRPVRGGALTRLATLVHTARAEAEAELGDRFDLPGFHEVVLRSGPLPLDILDEQVQRWVEERRAMEDAPPR